MLHFVIELAKEQNTHLLPKECTEYKYNFDVLSFKINELLRALVWWWILEILLPLLLPPFIVLSHQSTQTYSACDSRAE